MDKLNAIPLKKNGNKYLIFASTDKNKDALTKYTELWDEIKSLIDKINENPSEYGKDFIKIKFISDDNLPLNEILKLHVLTVIVRSAFKEDGKYYSQVFLDECLYELQMLKYGRIDISEGIGIIKKNFVSRV